jgi:hypothetical protein
VYESDIDAEPHLANEYHLADVSAVAIRSLPATLVTGSFPANELPRGTPVSVGLAAKQGPGPGVLGDRVVRVQLPRPNLSVCVCRVICEAT